ncbi:DinB family protein [Streptomyces zingiberis]|uniref:DinB family protein n=1 Tax=Streptomyces zingiberis TaxID=2053010 RepID=A0ABX1BPQ9_9ACTN|nr:DinB family protein [Streptomyces zingiberis]NJP99714.1 DinB family protein [Streptomyces zingiberis]
MTSSTPERIEPPLTAGERAGLESWLDFHRETLALKCEGLTDAQLREASVPPSKMTLLGLVQHLAEVERNWFHRVLLSEDAPTVFGDPGGSGADLAEADGGFTLRDDLTKDEVFARWRAEIENSRKAAATRELDDTGTLPPNPSPLQGPVSLRWIYLHLIEEYARHNGHADLLREGVDGVTGE